MPSLYTKIGNSSKFSMYKNERITNYHYWCETLCKNEHISLGPMGDFR